MSKEKQKQFIANLLKDLQLDPAIAIQIEKQLDLSLLARKINFFSEQDTLKYLEGNEFLKKGIKHLVKEYKERLKFEKTSFNKKNKIFTGIESENLQPESIDEITNNIKALQEAIESAKKVRYSGIDFMEPLLIASAELVKRKIKLIEARNDFTIQFSVLLNKSLQQEVGIDGFTSFQEHYRENATQEGHDILQERKVVTEKLNNYNALIRSKNDTQEQKTLLQAELKQVPLENNREMSESVIKLCAEDKGAARFAYLKGQKNRIGIRVLKQNEAEKSDWAIYKEFKKVAKMDSPEDKSKNPNLLAQANFQKKYATEFLKKNPLEYRSYYDKALEQRKTSLNQKINNLDYNINNINEEINKHAKILALKLSPESKAKLQERSILNQNDLVLADNNNLFYSEEYHKVVERLVKEVLLRTGIKNTNPNKIIRKLNAQGINIDILEQLNYLTAFKHDLVEKLTQKKRDKNNSNICELFIQTYDDVLINNKYIEKIEVYRCQEASEERKEKKRRKL